MAEGDTGRNDAPDRTRVLEDYQVAALMTAIQCGPVVGGGSQRIRAAAHYADVIVSNCQALIAAKEMMPTIEKKHKEQKHDRQNLAAVLDSLFSVRPGPASGHDGSPHGDDVHAAGFGFNL